MQYIYLIIFSPVFFLFPGKKKTYLNCSTPFNTRFSDVNGQLAFIGAEGAMHNSDLGDQR